MQRRSLLKLGAASALVLAAAGGSLALLRPGLHDARLSAAGREVMRAVGAAVLDGSLPTDGAQREPALAGLLDRVDGLIAALPAHAQSELSQLLAILASSAGRRLLAELAAPWDRASVAQVQQSLDAMRLSSLALRQQAYHALHDIVSGAYFSDAATWDLLGYPGPRPV